MPSSQYIRDNIVYSWRSDCLDVDEDVSTQHSVSGCHRQVNDENLEVDDGCDGTVIGINKKDFKKTKRIESVRKKDFEIDKGTSTWEDDDDDGEFPWSDDDDIEITGSDEDDD